ncbi:MAG TPA: hypothetical protein VNM90_19515 [Haliangium sp.]|nr:hypothetical protein [Haliangium sp.]
MRLPAADSTPWPDPDDHLVEPGTRWEVFNGERVYVSPARPGHGDLHTRLGSLLDEHVAADYTASTDLLTRRSHDNDFATDVSVRRTGRNPATGHRYLEEISFEIFFQESRQYARARARNVVNYGVRRMLGIFVRERYPDSDTDGLVDYTVAEWSAERDDWVVLQPGAVIEDPTLLVPIPVEALTDAVASRDAVARALLATRNRVLQEHAARERLAAAREYLFGILARRQIALDAAQRARIDACEDLATLERWLLRAIEVTDASALLG